MNTLQVPPVVNIYYNKIQVEGCSSKINNINHVLSSQESTEDNLCQGEKIMKEKFGCKICRNILYTPNMTKCCGETACYNCFVRYFNSSCPFCGGGNFKIMPNFKIQKMKDFVMKTLNVKNLEISKNISNYPNYNNYLPNPYNNFYTEFSNNKTNPHYDILVKSKFFIIKSFNHENIEISQRFNQWATSRHNQNKLLDSFENQNVILIFSVNKSSSYQGYAIMMSNKLKSNKIWNIENKFNLGGSFDIKWLCKSELPFRKIKNIYNPLNNNEPIQKSRDTQELPTNIGVNICSLCFQLSVEGKDGYCSINSQDIIREIEFNKRADKNYNYSDSLLKKKHHRNEKIKKKCFKKKSRSKSNTSNSD